MPPRVLKSRIVSSAFPAWVLARDPAKQILCISHSLNLSDDLAGYSLQTMQSGWYRHANPGTRLSKKRLGVRDFATEANGYRKAMSMDSNITGHGGDIIIIDDPIDGQKIYSDAERNKVNSKFETVIQSRLNNASEGAIIVVMQRLHEDDLAGFLERKYKFETLIVPLIAPRDKAYVFDDWDWLRLKGDVLDPEAHTPEWLENKKENTPSHIFEAQYQQNPIPPDGLLLKEEWFPLYDQLPKGNFKIFLSWDVGQQQSESSSYSVCTVWKTDGMMHFLIDVWRDKVSYEDLLDVARKIASDYKPEAILIENAALGTALISSLQRDNYPVVIIPKPQHEKVVRLNVHLGTLKAQKILLPSDAAWKGPLLQEFLRFPNGRYNDQVDSMTQYLTFMDTDYKPPTEFVVNPSKSLHFKEGRAYSPKEKRRKPHPMRDPKSPRKRRF